MQKTMQQRVFYSFLCCVFLHKNRKLLQSDADVEREKGQGFLSYINLFLITKIRTYRFEMLFIKAKYLFGATAEIKNVRF